MMKRETIVKTRPSSTKRNESFPIP